MKAMLVPKDGIVIFSENSSFSEYSLTEQKEKVVDKVYVENKMNHLAEQDEEEGSILILTDISKEDAIAKLKIEYKKHSALDYLLIVLNPANSFNVHQEALNIVEKLIQEKEIYNFLKELVHSEESLILDTVDIKELQKLSDKVGRYKLYSLVEAALLN